MKPSDKKSTQQDKVVQVFTKFANMKFLPEHIAGSKKQIQQPTIKNDNVDMYTKVKTYLGLSPSKQQPARTVKSPPKLKSLSIQSSSSLGVMTRQGSLSENQIMQNLSKLSCTDTPVTLKHLHKLTNDHFLIGDQDQLDVINVNCVVGDYIDSELVWSINIGKKILLVAVDIKRSIFALITQDKQIIVYEYLLKRNNQKPKRIFKFNIDQNAKTFQPKYAQFFRDSQLIIFFDTYCVVYSLQGNQIQRKTHQPYPIVKYHNLKLFQVPTAFQNKINVFFQQELPGQQTFSLWCLDIDLLMSGVKMNQLLKVYDIQLVFKKQLQIQNYSKDIYLLNLGFQIFAIKKGYVIDSANVNIQSQESFLCYLGNQKLIHITKTHVDVYKFHVKQTNPPKIHIKSLDSIVLPQISLNFQYFKVIQMLSSSLALFYQMSSVSNSLIGETRYKFGLTKRIPFEQKINMILPSQEQLSTLKSELIQQKCDVIKKMGLQSREVYLRIWNKSPKQRIVDFKFLLSTDHYETIKEEIQKKLRKTSMSYRELQTLQKVCCQMLSQKIDGPSFQISNLKNFLISHFLIKKYELYFEFSKIDKSYKGSKPYEKTQKPLQDSRDDQNKQIMINVQNYHKFSKADIKSMLLEYISEFCIEQKSEYVEKIRVILRNFRFCLRIDYLKLIEEMIKMSHNNLLVLIQTIPQILPYNPDYSDKPMPEQPELYQGVWSEITNEDWQKNLHKQKIITVYNKQILEQTFQSDVWYKRNWNTLHGCVFLTKQEIIQIHQRNKSQEIFYLIISQIYQKIESEQKIRQLLTYIQTSYNQVPSHLCHKIFLYKSLYDYFMEKQFDQDMTLKEFLKLQDFQLFKLIFKYQKTFKNLIFSQIKPLFKEICDSDQVFNQGLLNYFNSQLSQISDIKYLLNRMNNKKRQFHIQNQQTYQVLVKAIQSKIKIGSQDDIPIDQVLIYIQNIPLSSDNEIMQQLHVIEQINQESQKFRSMKLNMSLYQIINNPDSVISALIDYEIKQSRIFSLISINQIKNQTYRIIAQTQAIKQKIYHQEQSDLTFFIYLTKILQQQKMIDHAKELLNDRILSQYYTIDQMMIENLVLFMYKQKFSIDPVYLNNQSYISKLVGLLPEENQCRLFISNQLDLGVYLSPSKDPLWYPLTGQSSKITVFQLESYINNLPQQMLANLDAKLIFQKSKILQEIASDGQINNIQLHSIYEFIILKLIQNFQLRQALQKTKQYFNNCQRSSYDFLYPAMILSKVFHEFCEQNRQSISLCSRYLYQDPKTFIQLLQDLMTHKYNSSEQKAIIMQVLQKSEKTNHVFNQNSILLQRSYMQLLTDKKSPANKTEMSINFDILLIQVQKQLIKLKDDFKTFDFHIIFALLSNDPYVLVKWVFLQRFQLNLKNFRCFLSYFIKEDLFDKVSVLEFGKRLFKMIYVSIKQHRPIDQVIEEYKTIPITEIQQIQRIKVLENQMDRKISKSLQRFKSKFKMVKSQNTKIKASSLQEAHQKITRRVQQVKSPLNQLIQPFKYVFYDSDDDAQNKEQQVKRQEVNKVKKEEKNIFDAKLQRTLLMSRRFTAGKQANLYLSSDKSIPTNMFFSQNFGIKGNMLNELVKSKKFPTLKKSKDLLTFAKSGSIFGSGIVKNDQAQQYFDGSGQQKNYESQKKPKRKFNIAKAQSQYVNLDDFMRFQKLVNSIQRQKQTSQKSQVPSINQIQISRQLKMQTRTQSTPPQNNLHPQQQQGFLIANRHFSRIRKISEEIQDFDGTEYPSQSNVTKSVQSQQSVIDIEMAVEQNQDSSGQHNQAKSTINQILISKVIQQVLKIVQDQKSQNTGKIEIKSDLLDQEKTKQTFPDTIKLLVEKLYEQNKPVLHILNVIKALAEKYPQANINKTYLSIYMRMAQLHSKFSLKFPFRKVFVSSGLSIEKGSSSSLYSYLSPFLESYIDEENVLKVGKVLSLGFQKSQIELEVHFILLRKFIKQITLLKQKILQTNYINLIRRKQDVALYNSQILKIQTYLEKIPANVFIQKDQDIFGLLSSFQKQSKLNKLRLSQASNSSDFRGLKEFSYEILVAMILDSLRKRGEQKIAEMLKNKWEKNSW